MRINIPRLIETDEGTFHYCAKCEDYKPIQDFGKCPSCKTGYQYSCASCLRIRWRELNPEPISDEKALEFILTKMGYNTNGDKSIHQQFVEKTLEKHGVDVNKPKKRGRAGKYTHLNPPPSGTKEYTNWYNRVIRGRE